MLRRLGGVEFLSGSPEGMVKWSEQALTIYERLDDPEGMARSFFYIAEGLRDSGEFERSAELYNRAIDIRREHDLGGIAASLHSLGDLSLDKHLPTAEHYYYEALALAPRRGRCTVAGLLPGRPRLRGGTRRRRDDGWAVVDPRQAIEQRIGFLMLRAERVRYEQTLTPPCATEPTTAQASRTLPNSTYPPRSPTSSAAELQLGAGLGPATDAQRRRRSCPGSAE